LERFNVLALLIRARSALGLIFADAGGESRRRVAS
jgi:hypothetical protein